MKFNKYKIEYGHIYGEKNSSGHDIGVKYTKPIFGKAKTQKMLDKLNKKAEKDESIEYITLWEFKNGKWVVIG